MILSVIWRLADLHNIIDKGIPLCFLLGIERQKDISQGVLLVGNNFVRFVRKREKTIVLIDFYRNVVYV
jgi:hypothetical protein